MIRQKLIDLKFLLAFLSLLIFASGCGVYSTSVYPEASEITHKQEPLDLSVSMRELTAYSVGMQVRLGKKERQFVDAVFEEELRKTGLFKEVRSAGEDADVVIDKRYADSIAMSSNEMAEIFKWLIWGPVALFLPVPYPYEIGIDGTVELRAKVGGGQDLLLRQYKLSYVLTVWSGSLWGAIFDWKPYYRKIVEHEVAEYSKRILKDYDFLKEYARLKKANDIEGIKKLIPEVWSGVA